MAIRLVISIISVVCMRSRSAFNLSYPSRVMGMRSTAISLILLEKASLEKPESVVRKTLGHQSGRGSSPHALQIRQLILSTTISCSRHDGNCRFTAGPQGSQDDDRSWEFSCS